MIDREYGFALIHSPLVGPSSWQLVAARLRQRGYPVIAPELRDSEASLEPVWEQNAGSAAAAIQAASSATAWILVGHSGAGPLLPAIGERLKTPPSGYLFVDAGLPFNQATRLEMMRIESAEWAQDFEQYLNAGGLFPNWSEADLQEVIPDPGLRNRVVQELRPRGEAFFSERISFSVRWVNQPCGYIQFSAAYDFHARWVRQLNWPYLHLPGGHFHMLVEPEEAAEAILVIIHQMLVSHQP